VVVRIDCQPLAHTAAWHIAAYLEWKIVALKVPPAIARLENGAVLSGVVVCVRADLKIDRVGVDRIDGNRFNSDQVPVLEPDPVKQRDPFAGVRIPTIRSADIGAYVDKSIRGLAEDNSGYETSASANDHVAPLVGLMPIALFLRKGIQFQCTHDHTERQGHDAVPDEGAIFCAKFLMKLHITLLLPAGPASED
jgi:hypothetical protein